jgi:hypothetical protein
VIHRVLALLKRWGLGTCHGLRRQHIDTCLNEFVFRYDRRYYRRISFGTVLGLAAHHSPASCWGIIGQQNASKEATPVRRNPRRWKATSGMRQDGPKPAGADETPEPRTTG